MLSADNLLSFLSFLLSWLGHFSFSHFSPSFEPSQPRMLKFLWHPLLGRTLTGLNGPSTKLPSSGQGQGTSYCIPNAPYHLFKLSVGSLPIGSSLRQTTMFMYLNETILLAETGITPMRPLLLAPSQMQTSL